jgi:hypothetical protein
MRPNNYLILGEDFEDEFLEKGRRVLMFLDFFAIQRRDTSFKVVKNRFNDTVNLSEAEFQEFFLNYLLYGMPHDNRMSKV